MKKKSHKLEYIETARKKISDNKVSFDGKVTVGDMLDYIEKNKIPRDAKVITEHVNDSYLLLYNWGYYYVDEGAEGFPSIFLPPHNGFGSMEGKKYFVLWQHY